MSSKVIIRIGEESEHVDREHLKQRTICTYAENYSVVFANVDVYYVIVTEPEEVRRLSKFIEDRSLNDDEFTDQVKDIIRGMIVEYINENFEEFTTRVEKSIKTAHGVGVRKGTNRVVNAANRMKGDRDDDRPKRHGHS